MATLGLLAVAGCVGGARGLPDSGFDARADAGGVVDAPTGTSADAGWDAWTDASPPRPIAPLSTATVTTRRPTLQWLLAPGTDGARVEICADRACTMPVAILDVTGTSAQPTSDLPVGVVFWRLHSHVGTATGRSSVTWQFTVGARSAPVDASWGSTLDVNGDGLADLAVGAEGISHFGPSGPGSTFVYLGSASGPGTTPATALTGPDGAGGGFGLSVASAGDVDGDGFADLVVGTWVAGRAYLYLGSAVGIASTPATTLSGPDGANSSFGWSVAGIGDVNRDGFGDVAVGAYGAASNTGRAYLYLGSASGLSATPATGLTGSEPGGNFGASIASAGDLNGDGYADLAVGARGPDGFMASSPGHAYLYLGSSTGLGATPATVLSGPDGVGGAFGGSVGCAGDVNGDGYADVAVGAIGVMGTGRVYVYLGGASGLGATAGATVTGPDGQQGAFGRSMSAGDVNGDGYFDLAIGADTVYGPTPNYGRAYIVLGGPTGLAATPATTLTGPDGGNFGCSVAVAGDMNGDGYADLAVGAWAVASYTGSAYVYSGSANGVGAAPTTTLTGPDGPNREFGWSVSTGS
jgi:hypothetical protein